MKQYIALIRKEKGSCYGVDFPDFPGCITAADTLEDAQAQAVEVLDFHTEDMAEEGLPFPEPSTLDEVLSVPGNRIGLVVPIIVPLEEKKSKKQRVDVTISVGVLNQIDRYVKKTEGVNRSSFLADAAMERLQRVSAPARKKGKSKRAKKRVGKRA